MERKKWEIWLAEVKYEESDDMKKRPVLIVGEKDTFIISLKMTSHEKRHDSDYSLKHWQRAGLDKETVVRTSKICRLVESDFIHKLGRISEHDILEIQKIVLNERT